MRTTLELPDEILKKAKASAALQGISLKDYFTSALKTYQADAFKSDPDKRPERIKLPLIGASDSRTYQIDSHDIESALAETENIAAEK